MASRGASHPFVVFNSYFADRVPSLIRRLVDFQTASTFDPSNPELQFYCRREPAVRPLLSSISKHEPYLFPSRSTFQASPPPNAFPPKFGTRLRASSPDTSSARGFSYHLFIAILLSVASPARLTFISARTRTTGTERSTFLTESRWTRSSRAGLKRSAFIGRMTMVTCSMSCLVGGRILSLLTSLTFSS